MLDSRPPTKSEADWLDCCAQIPCVVCELYHGIKDTPAEIHHTDGKTKPEAHRRVISLCSRHHRIADTHQPKRWISRHGDGRALFEASYCSEGQLLEEQEKRVNRLRENTIGTIENLRSSLGVETPELSHAGQ